MDRRRPSVNRASVPTRASFANRGIGESRFEGVVPMDIEIGTRIVVESEKVGVEPRSGVVTGLGGSLVHVHWDSGEDSSFVPASGAMRLADA